MRSIVLSTMLAAAADAWFGSQTAAAAEKPASPSPQPAAAEPADAAKAWAAFLQTSQPPQVPESWQTNQPSSDEFERFRVHESTRLVKAADMAKEFQARFPNDSNAAQARSREYDLLEQAVKLGNTNVLARLDALDALRLKEPKLSEEDRYRIRITAVDRHAMSRLPGDMAGAMSELEKGGHELLKDYPNRAEPYEMLLLVASKSEPTKARDLAKEITASPAPENLKEEAQSILDTTERIGKPVPIKFAAVDGREVDMAKLRGKVVLVDFWATWCSACVSELPHVRAAYERLHPKGFEIVGISFDTQKDELLEFVKDQKMNWPQYFDGKKWDNEYGKQFGIQSLPTMWLIDRKGHLRDVNALDDLADRVEKLLAEQP